MLRAALGATVAVCGLAVAFLLLRPYDEPPPPVAYHSLERDIARVTLEGDRLARRGDACLQAMQQKAPAAVNQCRGFLAAAAQWARPLDSVGERLAALDSRLNDSALIAIGASGEQAVDTLAALAAVTGRLGSQVELVDGWMAGTAQASQTITPRKPSPPAD